MGTKTSRLLKAIRDVRDKLYAAVNEGLTDENRTYRQIADANGVSIATVQRVAERNGISRQVGPRPRSSGSAEVQDDDKQ